MKRFLVGFIVGAVIATTVTSFAVDRQVRLLVDGKEVSFPEAPPIMVNGRTMVPARPLAEALGATVTWDDTTASVIVKSKTPTDITAKSVPAPTIVVEGVTYYLSSTIKRLLLEKFGIGNIKMGDGITVNGVRYQSSTYTVDRYTGYHEIESLLDAGVITAADIDHYYGK